MWRRPLVLTKHLAWSIYRLFTGGMATGEVTESENSSWEDFLPPIPDMSHLITETEEPVDNIFSERLTGCFTYRGIPGENSRWRRLWGCMKH